MPESPERLNLPRTFKIGSFHIGSAFADILTSAIWNRILISNMSISATPGALRSALRYLMAPLSIWAGNRSDNHPLFGRRRRPYIWGERALMVLSLLFLPFIAMPVPISACGR
jgi:MFS transporter, BCD family, chlorophyll transporter